MKFFSSSLLLSSLFSTSLSSSSSSSNFLYNKYFSTRFFSLSTSSLSSSELSSIPSDSSSSILKSHFQSQPFNISSISSFSSSNNNLISSNLTNNISSTMASDTTPSNFNGRIREKVALKPGFHLSDWTRLTRVSSNLTGRDDVPIKVTREELAKHTSKFDMWTSYNGKVYNISPYLPYHPGGEEILLQCAGKDCTELFDQYHRWVNIKAMLSKCYIGDLID